MLGYSVGSSLSASALEIGGKGDSGTSAATVLAFLTGALRLALAVAVLRAGSFAGDVVRASLLARVARLARVAVAWGVLMSFAAAALVVFPEALGLALMVALAGCSVSFVARVARVVRVARATGLGATGLDATGLGTTSSAGAWVASAALAVRLAGCVAGFLVVGCFGEAAMAGFTVLVFLAAGATAAVGASSCAGRERLPVTRLGVGVGLDLGMAAALPVAVLPWERVATMVLADSLCTRQKLCVLGAVACWWW